MLDRKDLERMAKAARKKQAERTPSVGVVARDCPCIACHYNLKGVMFEGKCPECGTPVSRSINPMDPDAKPWEDPMQWRPAWWIRFFGPPAVREEKRSAARDAPKPKPLAPPQYCSVCGYDCTGVPATRPCPECGAPRAQSARASAIDVQQVIQALASRRFEGQLLVFGWSIAGIAIALQWLVFGAAVSFGNAPWALTGMGLYSVAAMGSAAATLGSLLLLLLNPPGEVARQTRVGTRTAAVLGCGLWTLTCPVIAFGIWRDWPVEGVLLAHAPLLIASILLAFYCRVMYVLATMVGRSERAVQSAAIGFPISVFVLLLSASWFVLVGTFPLISFVSFMFISLFCGVYTYRFFQGNANVGAGIWWSKRNLNEAVDRYRRKVEKWEARARIDREKERVHGNSSRL